MKEFLISTSILIGGFVILDTAPRLWLGWIATAIVILIVLYLTYDPPPSSPAN